MIMVQMVKKMNMIIFPASCNVLLFSDEGDYKCEITYLDINRSCPVVQVVFKSFSFGKKFPHFVHW